MVTTSLEKIEKNFPTDFKTPPSTDLCFIFQNVSAIWPLCLHSPAIVGSANGLQNKNWSAHCYFNFSVQPILKDMWMTFSPFLQTFPADLFVTDLSLTAKAISRKFKKSTKARTDNMSCPSKHRVGYLQEDISIIENVLFTRIPINITISLFYKVFYKVIKIFIKFFQTTLTLLGRHKSSI